MIELFARKIIDASTHKMEGKVAWRSPSNIAIIKYWGKYGEQLPRNPSISFTLSDTYTETSVQYKTKDIPAETARVTFYFENKPNQAFSKRIEKFLNKQLDLLPYLKNVELVIESQNSFPHSSGIASSASSMSALALCLLEIENKIFDLDEPRDIFLRKASYLARLASGSASRSVYPTLAVWGKTNVLEDSSDEYAIPFKDFHPVFHDFHDDILIISDKEKKVSSSVGHQLMNGNIYAANRYQQANARFEEVITHLRSGDVFAFGNILEDEALTLHALMMSSKPSFILLEPNTLSVINKLRDFRSETGIPLFFTLDAGPNLHLLYPDSHSVEIQNFIDTELKKYCKDGKILRDRVGEGPRAINSFSNIL